MIVGSKQYIYSMEKRSLCIVTYISLTFHCQNKSCKSPASSSVAEKGLVS